MKSGGRIYDVDDFDQTVKEDEVDVFDPFAKEEGEGADLPATPESTTPDDVDDGDVDADDADTGDDEK